MSDVYGCSTNVEQEKGCPYPALATPQLSIANPRTAKPEKNMTESKPILDHVSEGTECYKMMCRFQFCFQRYLADPVIRGANASYKKPGLNVEQVCRSTLQRNQLFEIC